MFCALYEAAMATKPLWTTLSPDTTERESLSSAEMRGVRLHVRCRRHHRSAQPLGRENRQRVASATKLSSLDYWFPFGKHSQGNDTCSCPMIKAEICKIFQSKEMKQLTWSLKGLGYLNTKEWGKMMACGRCWCVSHVRGHVFSFLLWNTAIIIAPWAGGGGSRL